MTATRGKSRLIDATERFLAARHFDRHAQQAFSVTFHRHYANAIIAERIQVAKLLSRSDGVPLDVLTLLCCDNSKVASHILSHSRILSEADLTTQILQGRTEERKAIARRYDLNSVLISQLLSFGEQAVAQILLANHALTTRITEKQLKRMIRLAGDANGQTGQHSMTTNKEKLDALVSSMEQDWADHYQPVVEPPHSLGETEETVAAGPDDSIPAPIVSDGQTAPATTTAAQPSNMSDQVDDSFLDANDMALLEQLGGEDWDQLDDDAIEALARSLAVNDLAAQPQQEDLNTPAEPLEAVVQEPQAEQEERANFTGLDDADLMGLAEMLAEEDLLEMSSSEPASQQEIYQPVHFETVEDALTEWDEERRGSFRIGVNDEANAPIPPLERLDPTSRAATISFRGSQMPEGYEEGYEQDHAAASASLVEPEIIEPAAVAPAPDPSDQPIAQRSEKSDALAASAEDIRSERKAQITLTIRKRSEDSEAQPESPLPAAAARIELTSATEDDWQQALSWLQRDVVPYSTARRETGESNAAPLANPQVAPETKNAEVDASDSAPALASAPQAEQISVGAATDRSPLSEPVDATPTERMEEILAEDVEAFVPDHERLSPTPAPQPSDFSEFVVQPAPAIQAETQGPLVHEHAPLGFMPDMVSFEGLELVEAQPDLPSVTDLLMEQQKQRATPAVELIEPVELAYLEDGKITSIDDIALAPMQVVVEQLAAERAAAHDKPAETIQQQESLLSQRAEEIKAEVLQTAANQASGSQASGNQASDMMELPAMADHHLVDAEEFSVLRSMEAHPQPDLSTQEIGHEACSITVHETPSVSLKEITGSNLNAEGMADDFYTYDDESRLTLLQSIISETLVEAAHLEHDISSRQMLSEGEAQELVMARFSNDRIKLADMLHDLSGHRRLDMTRLLQDTGGEALVVYLYHIGLDESGTLSMLLHGPDAVSHHYNKVAQLMTLYNQLYPAAADKIVRQLFGSGHRANTAIHQTQYDEGAGAASPRLRKDGQSGSAQDNSEQGGQKAPEFGRRMGFTK